MRSLSIALLLSTVLGACAVTEQDIETWKGTIRGPGKIVAVLLAEKYSEPLRVHAGMALVEMERQDVDGVSELGQAFQHMQPESRTHVVDGMAPLLLGMIRGEGETAPSTTGQATPRQIRAKDASFLLLQYASQAPQQQLVDGVVGWFAEDFNGRSLAGNFSAEQVVRQLGSPAASKLVQALNPRMPPAAITKIAELIGQVADDATKRAGGERLVAVEREMESPAFGEWIATGIRAQAQQSGRQVTPQQIAQAVEGNRESLINDGAIPALHQLAAIPSVGDRLLEIARGGAAVGNPSEDRRVRALQALEGRVRADQARPILQLALNPQTPTRVRDYAFDRVADSHNREAIPQLWPLATQAGEGDAWRVRWRVGSLLLTLGGREVMQEWLNRIPNSPYAREELVGYAERLAQVRPEPTDLMRTLLAAPEWYKQALALYYFDRKGVEADIPRIQAMARATTATVGEHWEQHDTIGKIAADVIASIRERAH